MLKIGSEVDTPFHGTGEIVKIEEIEDMAGHKRHRFGVKIFDKRKAALYDGMLYFWPNELKEI